jgi:hypothetical protein
MSEKPKAKHRIMMGPYDITDKVACLYDALVASMDWGSGFLDAETQIAALTIGHSMGWEVDLSRMDDIKNEATFPELPRPDYRSFIRDKKVDYDGYHKAQEAWRKQVLAAITAKCADFVVDEQVCEAVGIELLSRVTTPKK